MNPLRTLAVLLAATLSFGCASTFNKAPEPDTAARPLPTVALESALLYDLLSAEIALQRGQLAMATENYFKAAMVTRDPRLVKRAVRISTFARDQGKAVKLARLWVELEPSDVEARQTMAALLIHVGRTEEATEHLAKVLIAAGDDTHEGFQAVIGLLGRDTDKTQALRVFEDLIAKRRDEPNALYAHAQLAFMLGRHDAAMASLAELERRRPNWSKALVLKASVLRHMGRDDESRAAYRAALQADPEDHALRLTFAKQLVDERRFEEARTEFKLLAKKLPDSPEINYALGLLALQLGDLDAAEREFRGLIDAGQHNDEAAYALGQIAERREDPEGAVRWFSAVSEGSTNFIDSRVRVAAIISARDSLEAGRAFLHRLRDDFPDARPQLFLAEGELLRGRDQFAEAVELFGAGLSIAPDDAELRYARAMAAERLDRLDLLEKDLRHILNKDPENAQALNALGYTLADRTNRYQEAHDYVQRALAQHPDDPAINDSMGWVMFRLGRYDEAEKFLLNAASRLKDPEVAAHLGELYWTMGRKDEARRVWNEGLKDAPDDPVLKKVIERLTR